MRFQPVGFRINGKIEKKMKPGFLELFSVATGDKGAEIF